jgi:hypothetical protein
MRSPFTWPELLSGSVVSFSYIGSVSPCETSRPFPRPPAWICAFTTTLPPSSSAICRASAGVDATRPRGTATPCFANSALAWYSWIFTRSSPDEMSPNPNVAPSYLRPTIGSHHLCALGGT